MDNKNELILTIDQRNAYAEGVYGLINTDGIDIKSYLAETIEMGMQISYYQGIYDTYRIQSLHHIVNGVPKDAFKLLQKAEGMIETHNLDQSNYIKLYNAYVVYYIEAIGDMDIASKYCKLGIEKAEIFNDQGMLVRLKANLAVINLFFGHYNAALDLLQSALDYFESIGELYFKMYCYDNIGEAYLELGQVEEAYQYYTKGYELAKEMANVAVIQDTAIGLSKVYRARGQTELGTRILEDTVKVTDLSDNKKYSIGIYLELVQIFIDNKQYPMASDVMHYLKQLESHFDNKHLEQRFYEYKVQLAVALDDYKEAYYAHVKYQELTQAVNAVKGESAINEILQKEYNKTIARLETIAAIGRDLTTLRSLDQVSLEIRAKLHSVMLIDNINISEIVDGFICNEHSFDGDVKLEPSKIPLDNKKSLAAWAVNHNREILINDLDRDYRLYVEDLSKRSATPAVEVDADGKSIPKRTIQSLMFSPLVVRDKIVGVFSIQSYEKNAYSSEELEIFKIIALYVAIAMENTKQSKALEKLALMDSLTEIYNRGGFTKSYNQMITESEEPLASIAMIMMDLDYFKAINDYHGHLIGDKVLKVVGKRLKLKIDPQTIVARLGGEEFGLLRVNSNYDDVLKLAEQIRRHIQSIRVSHKGEFVPVTTSVGVTFHEMNENITYEQLFHEADEALYKAKRLGRNRVEVYKQ